MAAVPTDVHDFARADVAGLYVWLRALLQTPAQRRVRQAAVAAAGGKGYTLIDNHNGRGGGGGGGGGDGGDRIAFLAFDTADDADADFVASKADNDTDDNDDDDDDDDIDDVVDVDGDALSVVDEVTVLKHLFAACDAVALRGVE
jgi:hypothetical protein